MPTTSKPADIVLATINARYIHSSLGLRYLLANMGPLTEQTALLEFGLEKWPSDICEEILCCAPKVVGFGVYIWNLQQTTDVVDLLKQIQPDLKIVLGGPEVSYNSEHLRVVQMADHIICGEADLAISQLCQQLLAGDTPDKWLRPTPPELDLVASPYHLYSDTDIQQRVIYVEASRGCPYRCAFCLSSRDKKVRLFAQQPFLQSMQELLKRGALRFKFVDRCFHLSIGCEILRFFFERYRPGMFLHFEWIPQHLPQPLLDIIGQFPAASVQLEAGVQTFDPQVARRIDRKIDPKALAENLLRLRQHSQVHIHADLIVGLPGESLQSFASGFDQLYAMQPQEIQVGFLKKLKGTAIHRHDTQWQMAYQPFQPFEILQNSLIDFATMQSLKRFGRFWDLLVNSGHFVTTIQPVLQSQPFAHFWQLSVWLFAKLGRAHSIKLDTLASLLHRYITEHLNGCPEQVAQNLLQDYRRAGKKQIPLFIRELTEYRQKALAHTQTNQILPKRQSRHLPAMSPRSPDEIE